MYNVDDLGYSVSIWRIRLFVMFVFICGPMFLSIIWLTLLTKFIVEINKNADVPVVLFTPHKGKVRLILNKSITNMICLRFIWFGQRLVYLNLGIFLFDFLQCLPLWYSGFWSCWNNICLSDKKCTLKTRICLIWVITLKIHMK